MITTCTSFLSPQAVTFRRKEQPGVTVSKWAPAIGKVNISDDNGDPMSAPGMRSKDMLVRNVKHMEPNVQL
jgi:hypothetical protein